MPVDILIYAVIAAVMVFWLRNVIGTRHGEERQRPNPFDVKDTTDGSMTDSNASADTKAAIENAVLSNALDNHIDGSVDAGLVQIALADKTFDIGSFKENAGDAFSIIVTAFADADRDTLRDLCSKDVYATFDRALREREAKGESVSTEILAIRKSDITAAGIDSRKQAFVTIRFTADETYVIKDKDGKILAGHPDRVTEMTDKWTFGREIRSSDPRWFLIKTEDDVVEEDGKTPVPDAG
jgi:predicted lipid-binding transport protein (Tim44 family)